ncbi:MAG: hypothetical protein K9L98_03680 [Candidatus Pacebacteria bacterium]|nr:hypothetical protein [Candidatus Paceibacterota bacterium]MCF7863078.1 hypothetical protein [Candidatus Paceibacterota bacterium]
METETKACQNCKKDFLIESNDLLFYERMKVPLPSWCSECRMVRRLVFRNERSLFRRKNALTDKDLFSGFPPEANLNTYENDYWFGDQWDPTDYQMSYDFSKPFFEQFKELFSKVPLPAKSTAGFMVNSDYCNEVSSLRNAYLCFDADFVENSAYLVKATNVNNSFDSHEVIENELCYEDVMVYKSYRTFFSLDCESCVDVWFSKGLKACTNCFGCVNLTGKSYYFFNEPLSKEEYENKISQLNLDSHQSIISLRQKVLDFWKKFPVKYYHGIRNINCTGERISDSKNVLDSVSIQGGENLRYVQISVLKATNSYDCVQLFLGAENAYECVTCGEGVYNLKYSFNCWEESRDLEYSAYCVGSSNCFGCVGLKNKQYCILNKQYTKEEYFELREKIIKHMDELPYVDSLNRKFKYGEFFPAEFSPLAYNESLVQDYIPLDSKEAKEKGFLWREPNPREFDITIIAKDLADSIKNVSEDILNEVIQCESCKRAYRIINNEFQFYKRIGIPIPHKCHNCRFLDRYQFINKIKLYDRACMCNKKHTHLEGKCDASFRTSYSLDQPDIVYCEKCYQQEIY